MLIHIVVLDRETSDRQPLAARVAQLETALAATQTSLAKVTAERDKLRRAYEQLKEQLELLRRSASSSRRPSASTSRSWRWSSPQTQAKLDALATQLSEDAAAPATDTETDAAGDPAAPPTRRQAARQADGPPRPGRRGPARGASGDPRPRARGPSRAHRLRGELQGALPSRRSRAGRRRASDLQDPGPGRPRAPHGQANLQAGHGARCPRSCSRAVCSRPR